MSNLFTRYFIILLFATQSFAQPAFQINGVNGGIPITHAQELFSFNGLLYFNGDLNGKNHQLVRSDGNNAGTFMPKIIPCNNQWDECGKPTKFIQVNDQLFFCQSDSLGTRKIWMTDINGSTPKIVKNFNQSGGQGYRDGIVFKNKFFFILDSYNHGTEIWASDGTDAGTLLVKEINAGAGNSPMGFLVVMNDILYFFADDGIKGTELWKTDGTTAGTTLLKDINIGPGSSVWDNGAVAVNGTFYFAANDGAHGVELWKCDGTSAGTKMVKDIIPGLKSSEPRSFVTLNNIAYFIAADSSYLQTPSNLPLTISNYELFRSDGTSTGTYLVKDINGTKARGSLVSSKLLICNGKIIFPAGSVPSPYDDNNELYRSDGTSQGTQLIQDINPGSGSSHSTEFKFFGNDTIFFRAFNEASGQELWMTNGEENGTYMVCDVIPGSIGSFPVDITAVNNNLYFTTEGGNKLWKIAIPKAASINANVFPNPFNEQLNIYLMNQSSSNIKVNMYNLLGEIIYNNEFSNKKNISLNDLGLLPNGIYIIEIISDNEQIKQKLVKYN